MNEQSREVRPEIVEATSVEVIDQPVSRSAGQPDKTSALADLPTGRRADQADPPTGRPADLPTGIEIATLGVIEPGNVGQMFYEARKSSELLGVEVEPGAEVESVLVGGDDVPRVDGQSWTDALQTIRRVAEKGAYILLMVKNTSKEARKIRGAIVLRVSTAPDSEEAPEKSKSTSFLTRTKNAKAATLPVDVPVVAPETPILVILTRWQAAILTHYFKDASPIQHPENAALLRRMVETADRSWVPDPSRPEQQVTSAEVAIVLRRGTVDAVAEALRYGRFLNTLSDEQQAEILSAVDPREEGELPASSLQPDEKGDLADQPTGRPALEDLKT